MMARRADGPPGPPKYAWSGTRVWLVNQTGQTQRGGLGYRSNVSETWTSMRYMSIAPGRSFPWYTKVFAEYDTNPVDVIRLKTNGRSIDISPAGHDGDKTVCIYLTTASGGGTSVSEVTDCDDGPPEWSP